MKTPDNFDLGRRADHAIYLPAVNAALPKLVDRQLPDDRRFPVNFDLTDLAFWTGTSRLWNHMFLLHSIGNYSVSAFPKQSMFHRKPNSFTFVGDSGGFQIGKGTLEGLIGLTQGMSGSAAVAAWNLNYDAKIWIVNWLEQNSDYAMTLDMPLWANTQFGTTSPFHNCSEQQLLNMTLDNLKIIERNRVGKTKWLNAIQGTNAEDTIRWWDAVKYFRYGGWSLAGAAGWRGGLHNMLSTILRMRDERAFEKGQDWLHVLGVSTPLWAILLTAIQIELRKINSDIQVSFDSASPFQTGGARDEYCHAPLLTLKPTDWVLRNTTLKATRHHANPQSVMPFPEMSPIGAHFFINHFVIKDDEFSGRRIDDISNALLINHNMWVYLDAFRRANALAFATPNRPIPNRYAEVIDTIYEAFTVDNWADFLAGKKVLLDYIAKSEY